MILELHAADFRKPKKAYFVEFFDLEKDEEEPTSEWISLKTLVEYVFDNELYTIPMDVTKWIEDNETFVIKHYLEKKYAAI